MNEIASDLGAFTGGLVFAIVSWKVGAYLTLALTQKPGLSAFIGGMLSIWYAGTRDNTAARWGAVLAIALLVLNHWASEGKPK